MNDLYGFRTDVINKVDRKECYDVFQEAFASLPLCSTINKKVFLTHGGLVSDDDTTLHQINMLKRNRQPATEGLMSELLWSEPQEEEGRVPGKEGKGILFGPDVTETFLKTNNLDLIIRSNALKMDGHGSDHNGKVITVFSAPNFRFRCNRGAFIRFEQDLEPKITSFDPVPSPKPKLKEFGSNSYLI